MQLAIWERAVQLLPQNFTAIVPEALRRYEGLSTKPQRAPPVPGNTEWERFDNAVGIFLNAPKQAFVKQEKKLKRRQEKKAATQKAN
jgi:hypothetical protein